MNEVTVTSCTKVKEWNGKPIYSVELSDGTKGQSFANEIPIGTPSSDLIIEQGEFCKKFKLKSKTGGGGFAGKPKGNESFALAYAKDIAVALLQKQTTVPSSADLAKITIAIANHLFEWLESKKK